MHTLFKTLVAETSRETRLWVDFVAAAAAAAGAACEPKQQFTHTHDK
jgi:hypothetical protein